MIVSSNKGLFFMATALMCSASLYGAELAVPSSDPLTRIFTGEPNRLTLPPGFPDTPLVSLDREAENCTPRLADGGNTGAALHTASATSTQVCFGEAQAEPGARLPSSAVSALAPEAQATVEPASVVRAVRSH